MSVLLFGVLAVGAVARITRLITADHITGWLRAKVITRYGQDSNPAVFVACPWCVSMWVAPIVLAIGWWPAIHGTATWWWLPAAALTASHATGVLAALTDD